MDTVQEALNKIHLYVRKLDQNQGRIARRNSRRAVLGALRRLRTAIDRHYPPIRRAAAPRDRIEMAAGTMDWRKFDRSIIRHVKRRWDRGMAERFNRYAASRLGVAPKPLVFNLHSVRILGQHTADQIRMNPGEAQENRWRTLLHEIAHYRVCSHRRAFVRELATVYRLWLQFQDDESRSRVPPRRRMQRSEGSGVPVRSESLASLDDAAQ
jgi:hypothetical protein